MTDQPTVERLAAHWASTGWPARAGAGVIEAAYSAPSAGPSRWERWALSLKSAVGVGAMGAMRWRFARSSGLLRLFGVTGHEVWCRAVGEEAAVAAFNRSLTAHEERLVVAY